MFDITPLRSGVYGASAAPPIACALPLPLLTLLPHFLPGTPFKLHYWLAQTLVYLVVMLLEKLMVGPLIAFKFWKEVTHTQCSSLPLLVAL